MFCQVTNADIGRLAAGRRSRRKVLEIPLRRRKSDFVDYIGGQRWHACICCEAGMGQMSRGVGVGGVSECDVGNWYLGTINFTCILLAGMDYDVTE